MKNSNSNDWLIPLLAAFAIYLPLSTAAPSPDQQSSTQPQPPALIQMVPTATPTPTPGPGRVPGEAARLLCDFFGLEPDQDQNAGLNPQQKSEVDNRRGDYCRIKSALNSNGHNRSVPSGVPSNRLITFSTVTGCPGTEARPSRRLFRLRTRRRRRWRRAICANRA